MKPKRRHQSCQIGPSPPGSVVILGDNKIPLSVNMSCFEKRSKVRNEVRGDEEASSKIGLGLRLGNHLHSSLTCSRAAKERKEKVRRNDSGFRVQVWTECERSKRTRLFLAHAQPETSISNTDEIAHFKRGGNYFLLGDDEGTDREIMKEEFDWASNWWKRMSRDLNIVVQSFLYKKSSSTIWFPVLEQIVLNSQTVRGETAQLPRQPGWELLTKLRR